MYSVGLTEITIVNNEHEKETKARLSKQFLDDLRLGHAVTVTSCHSTSNWYIRVR